MAQLRAGRAAEELRNQCGALRSRPIPVLKGSRLGLVSGLGFSLYPAIRTRGFRAWTPDSLGLLAVQPFTVLGNPSVLEFFKSGISWWVLWHRLDSLTFERLKQEDHQNFEANIGYVVMSESA